MTKLQLIVTKEKEDLIKKLTAIKLEIVKECEFIKAPSCVMKDDKLVRSISHYVNYYSLDNSNDDELKKAYFPVERELSRGRSVD